MGHWFFAPRFVGSQRSRRAMRMALAVFMVGTLWLFCSSRVPAAAASKAPELIGAPQEWVNTDGKALSLYAPDGKPAADKVYLIDFWEYTCVNCLRTLPYLEAWDKKYRQNGLVIIGIHTPEFGFAHDGQNVREAVKRLGIEYPVLIDSDSKNWNAYKNNVWPRHFVLDSAGHVLADHSGEGGYQETEQIIRAALHRLHPDLTFGPLTATVRDSDKPGAVCYPETQEAYCGYARGGPEDTLGNKGGYQRDQSFAYKDSGHHEDGTVTLSGQWTAAAQSLRHDGANATDYALLRYHALDANAVIKPETSQPFDVTVLQDGKPVLKKDAGADIRYDAQGRSFLRVDAPRMYQITHNAKFGAHDLKLQTASDGFGLYSFAFSSCTVGH